MFIDSSVQFSVFAVKNAGNRLDEAFFSVLSVLIEVESLFTVVTLAHNQHQGVNISDFFRWQVKAGRFAARFDRTGEIIVPKIPNTDVAEVFVAVKAANGLISDVLANLTD